jgi:WD40 repeat protein
MACWLNDQPRALMYDASKRRPVLYDLTTRQPIQTLEACDPPTTGCLAGSAEHDCCALFVPASDKGAGGELIGFDTTTGRQLWSRKESRAVHSFLADPEGKRLVIGFPGRNVRVDLGPGMWTARQYLRDLTVCDPRTGNPLATWPGEVWRQTVTRGGDLLLVTGDGPDSPHTIRLVRSEKATEIWAHPEAGPITTWAISPDGQLLAVLMSSAGQPHLRILDMRDGEPISELSGERPTWSQIEIQPIAFTPDGQRLAVAYSDGAVRLWDPRAGREVLTLADRGTIVNHLAFTVDGSRLVGFADKSFLVWKAAP